MKTISTQQEILLMTGTNFSSRQCCKKDDDSQKSISEKEQLEEACWNGLIKEMLPEIYEEPAADRKLYLWQIREAASFLGLELGELPAEKDYHLSIDPYLFMTVQSLS